MRWMVSLGLLVAGPWFHTAVQAEMTERVDRPNFVVIFLDDAGWGDFATMDKGGHPTPQVARLAREGCVFSNFYVPQAVCSASRAALLSGCYPGRTGVHGAHGPGGRGLEPRFTILAELLKGNGYSTACFGKWHIGDQPDTRPPARGFDESAGLMISNDMWKYHPSNPEHWGKHPLTFRENGKIAIPEVEKEHQRRFTSRYTERAVDFIRRSKDKPFFLYLAHAQPHVPLFCSDRFEGKTGRGLYADVIAELDWSVGRVLDALREHDVEQRTLVLFSSDNGPWLSYGDHAGRTPFREGKQTSFEGGVRSPCVIRYPPRIASGSVSSATFCSIDLLPTFCRLSGTGLPPHPIDGRDVWDLVTGQPDARNPHAYYAFSRNGALQAVMSGDGTWKLYLPHDYPAVVEPGSGGQPGRMKNRHIEWALFNLREDPEETTNVIDQHPSVADQLRTHARRHKASFYPDAGD